LFQGFGTILGLQCVDVDQYKVVFASDNSLQVLGTGHNDLFALGSFCDLIIESDRPMFVARLQSILDNTSQPKTHSSTLRCSVRSTGDASASFWCTAHKPKGYEDIVICEFEPFSAGHDAQDNLSSATETPTKTTKIFSYQPSAEEWTKSTTRTSKPIHPWYRLKKENTSKSPADLINAITEVQTQLISTTSLESLFGVIVGTVSELTDFDRVMLYRFDECKCGAVVAEYLSPRVSEDLFIGLHFPSSDLPLWIRELYKHDRVQLLRNRTSKRTSIVYRNPDDLANIDLTKAYLREVSPDKIQLFADLHVTSAMSISLVVDGELWGLIMCHSYGRKVVEISPPAREVFRTIGDCVSSQIERKHFPYQ
jgi:light-regulated signal transduction histidine kinase (bacteriophytochrome)